MKFNNVSKSITTNPLFGVVMALVLLLVALAIIRMFQPSFSMGAEIGGHVGTLEGNLKLEAYQNENFTGCGKCHGDDCDTDGFMNHSGNMEENESFMNLSGATTGENESFMNHIGTEAENESFIPAPSPFPNIQ